MATPTLVTVRDFTNSRYAQLAENADSLDIADVLASAEVRIQSRLGRQIGLATYTEVIRNCPTQTIHVLRRPITSITSIRRRTSILGAWNTMDLSRVMFEPGPGYIEMYDDIRGFDVEVTYQAGYATLPSDLKEAILLQAVLLATQDFEVYGTGDSEPPGYIEYMNMDIDKMLFPYRATASVYH